MSSPKEVYFTWPKGTVVQISEFFTSNEFDCHCEFKECREQKISLELIRRLDWLRRACNSPLRVHSGYRCAAYQQKIRDDASAQAKENEERKKHGLPPLPITLTVVATTKSTHELGHAADVSASNLKTNELLNLAASKFKSIGIALNFLHLDLRDDKERRWNY